MKPPHAHPWRRIAHPAKFKQYQATVARVPLKQWRMEEAARLGLSESAIAMRMSRGSYPLLRIIRESPRRVFVEVEKQDTQTTQPQ
jgi:hypothetical protein